MLKAIKRLFVPKNVLILLVTSLALLGVIVPDLLQRLGFSLERVILALLAGLAIDTLIERLGYLERIESQVFNLERRIESHVSADNLFERREEMRQFSLWLQESEEIWVSGEDVMNLINTYGGKIQEAAKEGRKRFRFLLVNPDNAVLMNIIAASSVLYADAPAREMIIRQVLVSLERLAENSPQGAIEVRLADWVPTNSYLIADGGKEHGRITVELFGYQIHTGERVHINLNRATDPRTFAYHFSQFESMWHDAKPYPTNHSTGQ